jgi:hypothetical protein
MTLLKGLRAAVSFAALLAFGLSLFAQGQLDQPIQAAAGVLPQRLDESRAKQALAASQTTQGPPANLFSPGLPLYTYTVKSSRDGNTYSGQIVGQNPENGGITIVPTVVIPIRFVFEFSPTSKFVFDPTATDPGCLGPFNTGLGLTVESPIFQFSPFTLVTPGDDFTQYPDHFNRANFWKIVGHPALFHTLLSFPIVLPVQTVTLPASASATTNAAVFEFRGQCGTNTGNTNIPGGLGIVNIFTWDPIAQSLISSLGLNATEFPLFVFYNAAMSIGPASNLSNCCVLGYHNALGNPGQTYAVSDFEGRNQTLFEGTSDVSGMSHEVDEWMQDPNGVNPTPAWGGVGQDVGACQNNYEVGDPLSGTLFPSVTGFNGFTYHLQELAFFSWFYGGPSIAINGWFSDNNTFKAPAATCPPGGV